MFDISFSELMVIAVVALIVIGPEKLPKVARTAGAFFGRMQRFVAQVKDEVNRESRFAELQHLQQEVQSSLQQGVNEIEQSILPPASAAPVTIEGEVTPVKKTRKPLAKKIANAELLTAAAPLDAPTPKPVRPRKARVTKAESPAATRVAEPAGETPVVAANPRKPRAKKVAADAGKDSSDV